MPTTRSDLVPTTSSTSFLVSPSRISLTFPSSPPNPHHLPPSSPPLLTPASPLSMGPFLVRPDRGLMLGGSCPLRRIKTPVANGGGYGAWFFYRGSSLTANSVSLGNLVVRLKDKIGAIICCWGNSNAEDPTGVNASGNISTTIEGF
ncbi:hypothetical protein RHGRI_015323 [Rhododendron griersonianum]|uniref:Uncharacterized protein n=1 Tax=Rhododendron griersonianum TaxID=479676 RepID=A0AAV6KDD4_9ERIC|nr:hypothetical protein RHGRI_015323 [Rhododendron griersonianum]